MDEIYETDEMDEPITPEEALELIPDILSEYAETDYLAQEILDQYEDNPEAMQEIFKKVIQLSYSNGVWEKGPDELINLIFTELVKNLGEKYTSDILSSYFDRISDYSYILEMRDGPHIEFHFSQIISLIDSIQENIELRKKYIFTFIDQYTRLIATPEFAEVVRKINDPKFNEEILESAVNSDAEPADITELIKLLNDKKLAQKLIDEKEEYNLSPNDITELIKVIDNPEYTKECIEDRTKYGLSPSNVTELIKSINNPEYTKECIEDRTKYELDTFNVTKLIISLDNPVDIKQYIVEWEKYELKPEDVVDLIISVNDPGYIKDCIKEKEKYGLNDVFIWRLILKGINDHKYTKECILECKELGLGPFVVGELIESLNDPEDFIEIINKRNEIELSTSTIVCGMRKLPEEEIFKILKECNDLEITKEMRQRYLTNEKIYENLDVYLEIEGKTEHKDTILRMYDKNNDILKVDFDILDYIKYFGEERVNLLSCYKDVVDIFKTLSETKLLILQKCIDYYEEKTGTEEWTVLASKILSNINNIDDSLLQKILEESNEKEINVENLIQLLMDGNNLNITTLEDFENYDKLKEQWCDKVIESGSLEECKAAVLEKIFDQNLRETKEILNKYGNDIDKIEDESLKNYIKALQKIVNCDDIDILKDIYNTVKPIEIPNIITIERLLKIEYAKLYSSDVLFQIEDAEPNEELGKNVYEAGTNFSMIITSVSAYIENDNPPENFEKDWNRPALGSQHFCASFIRNDMLGTAPVPYVCFGFSNMREDALMLSGATDMYSSGVSFVSTAGHGERYYAPDNQVNNTTHHNEMCWRRMQNGEKKKPDYIVVFKAYGTIEPDHWNYALQAQKDFGGKLPIVIIDIEKCLESERQKLDEMVALYKANPSPELLIQIRQKIKNNNITCEYGPFSHNEFGTDINLEQLELLSESKDLMRIGNLLESKTITNHVQSKTDVYNDLGPQVPLSSLLENVQELEPLIETIAEVQFNNKSTSKAHGVQHVKNVLLLSNYIALRDGVSEEDLAIIREAAIYHDVLHKEAGDPAHAKEGADWYLKNVESTLNKEEVAFLIEAHEIQEDQKFIELVQKKFPNISEKRKMELIKCARILQDADRLDMLRYDIENPNYQRFNRYKLNDKQNEELISAVIELNTRQAMKSGYLHIENGKVIRNEGIAKAAVTEKELQECYKETTPEEREQESKKIVSLINNINLER